MTIIHDSQIALKLRELHERLDELRAAITCDQTGEYVREVVADLRRLAKACERTSTNMIESFSAEIRDLKLANETLQAKGALHQAVFDSGDTLLISWVGDSREQDAQGWSKRHGQRRRPVRITLRRESIDGNGLFSARNAEFVHAV